MQHNENRRKPLKAMLKLIEENGGDKHTTRIQLELEEMVTWTTAVTLEEVGGIQS